MINFIAKTVAAYAITTTIVAHIYLGIGFSTNVLIGSAVVFLNLAALTFSWKRIFSKKTIALAVFVIIFKYVILGMVLWALSVTGWLNIVGFLIGLASLLFSVFTAILTKSLSNKKI